MGSLNYSVTNYTEPDFTVYSRKDEFVDHLHIIPKERPMIVLLVFLACGVGGRRRPLHWTARAILLIQAVEKNPRPRTAA